MTDHDRQQLRNRLTERLESVTRGLVRDEMTLGACADDNEYASLLSSHHLELCLAARELAQVRAMERALERLDGPYFGICEECGDDIGHARLLANPAATLCIHCQSERERGLGACA